MAPEFNLKKKHSAFISKNFKWEERSNETILIDVRDQNKVLDPYGVETKVEIYQDRVMGWFLDYGEQLKNKPDGEFLLLQIAVGYIEGNQQLREGCSSKNRSEAFFKSAVKRIFGQEVLEDDAVTLYEEVRCGLFHDGMPSKRVLLSNNFETAIRHYEGGIYINSRLFFEKIKVDCLSYVRELKQKDDPALLRNFEKMFYFGQEESVR